MGEAQGALVGEHVCPHQHVGRRRCGLNVQAGKRGHQPQLGGIVEDGERASQRGSIPRRASDADQERAGHVLGAELARLRHVRGGRLDPRGAKRAA